MDGNSLLPFYLSQIDTFLRGKKCFVMIVAVHRNTEKDYWPNQAQSEQQKHNCDILIHVSILKAMIIPLSSNDQAWSELMGFEFNNFASLILVNAVSLLHASTQYIFVCNK